MWNKKKSLIFRGVTKFGPLMFGNSGFSSVYRKFWTSDDRKINGSCENLWFLVKLLNEILVFIICKNGSSSLYGYTYDLVIFCTETCNKMAHENLCRNHGFQNLLQFLLNYFRLENRMKFVESQTLTTHFENHWFLYWISLLSSSNPTMIS